MLVDGDVPRHGTVSQLLDTIRNLVSPVCRRRYPARVITAMAVVNSNFDPALRCRDLFDAAQHC